MAGEKTVQSRRKSWKYSLYKPCNWDHEQAGNLNVNVHRSYAEAKTNDDFGEWSREEGKYKESWEYVSNLNSECKTHKQEVIILVDLSGVLFDISIEMEDQEEAIAEEDTEDGCDHIDHCGPTKHGKKSGIVWTIWTYLTHWGRVPSLTEQFESNFLSEKKTLKIIFWDYTNMIWSIKMWKYP